MSGGRDKVVHVWDLATYKLETTVPVYETLEGIKVRIVGYQASPVSS